MLPSAITKKMVTGWGGEAIYAQAEQLVKRGAVLKADMKGDLLTGVIARDSASELYTKLRLRPNGTIESLCPCFTNRNQGLVCPHVVALGITLMLRHADPLREQKYQEDQRRARRLAEVDAAAYIQRSPFGAAARLSLTLPPSWIADFRKGRVAVGLLLLTGSETLTPEAASCNGARFELSPEDDNLLTVLEDICEGPPPGRFEVSAADFLNILDVAAHARLAVAGKGELTVEAAPQPTTLHVDLDHDTGELIIYPYTELPYARTGELAAHLVNGRRGRVVANGHAWPMKNVLPVPYHGIYLQDEIVPRERVINFLRRDLPCLQSLAPVEMELTADLFAAVPGTPLFRLELQGSRASLRARSSGWITFSQVNTVLLRECGS